MYLCDGTIGNNYKVQCFEITDFCEKEVIPMDLEIEQ